MYGYYYGIAWQLAGLALVLMMYVDGIRTIEMQKQITVLKRKFSCEMLLPTLRGLPLCLTFWRSKYHSFLFGNTPYLLLYQSSSENKYLLVQSEIRANPRQVFSTTFLFRWGLVWTFYIANQPPNKMTSLHPVAASWRLLYEAILTSEYVHPCTCLPKPANSLTLHTTSPFNPATPLPQTFKPP